MISSFALFGHKAVKTFLQLEDAAQLLQEAVIFKEMNNIHPYSSAFSGVALCWQQVLQTSFTPATLSSSSWRIPRGPGPDEIHHPSREFWVGPRLSSQRASESVVTSNVSLSVRCPPYGFSLHIVHLFDLNTQNTFSVIKKINMKKLNLNTSLI